MPRLAIHAVMPTLGFEGLTDGSETETALALVNVNSYSLDVQRAIGIGISAVYVLGAPIEGSLLLVASIANPRNEDVFLPPGSAACLGGPERPQGGSLKLHEP